MRVDPRILQNQPKASTEGYGLMKVGSGLTVENGVVSAPSGATGSSTVESETTFGESPSAGVASTYSRGDHTHGTPPDPIPDHVAEPDPHPQYLTQIEGDALYEDLGAAAAAVATHVAASDPHTQYQKESEKGAASGYASLNGSSKVVEDPANATATPTASKIPIANGSGSLDSWVTYRPSGATDVAVADGGTGASDAATARTNLGLGSIATQAASNVSISGGTITGTRVNPRTVAAADATSITPTGDTADTVTQTNSQAAGTLTVNAPTGTPVNNQRLTLRIKSTNQHTFSWNAIYRGGTTVTLPTTNTGSGKTDYFGFIYNATDSKWDLVAAAFGYT